MSIHTKYLSYVRAIAEELIASGEIADDFPIDKIQLIQSNSSEYDFGTNFYFLLQKYLKDREK